MGLNDGTHVENHGWHIISELLPTSHAPPIYGKAIISVGVGARLRRRFRRPRRWHPMGGPPAPRAASDAPRRTRPGAAAVAAAVFGESKRHLQNATLSKAPSRGDPLSMNSTQGPAGPKLEAFGKRRHLQQPHTYKERLHSPECPASRRMETTKYMQPSPTATTHDTWRNAL